MPAPDAPTSPQPAPAPAPGADDHLVASFRIALRFVLVCVLVALTAWSLSGIQQLQPGDQALILRTGAVVRLRSEPGLVLAWPAPIEAVLVVPARERQLVTSLDLSPLAEAQDKPGLHPRQDGGYLLSGDLAAVHVQAQILWSIEDPRRQVLLCAAPEQVIRRATRAALIANAAGQHLDSLLLGQLEAFQVAVQQDLSARLQRLALGVMIHRVELTLALPQRAQTQVDQAQAATAEASRRVAQAETSARHLLQQANREADQIRQAARTAADEAIAQARLTTDPIAAQIAAGDTVLARERLARDGLEAVLEAVGRVITVPVGDHPHLLLPAGPIQVR